MNGPCRPGNHEDDGPDWRDTFQNCFLAAVFIISGAGLIGLMAGLIIGAIR